jgi:hypothetical protein
MKEAEMKIVGCDLHARRQTIAMVDETGEFTTKEVLGSNPRQNAPVIDSQAENSGGNEKQTGT